MPDVIDPNQAKTGSNARKHHYVSACYLKNFASPNTRKGRFYCLDKEQKKQFPTTPNDAGTERDFNRVEVEGVHPNFLEDALANFVENDFPKASEYIETYEKIPGKKSEFYNILMTVISLFSVRYPAMRSRMEEFDTHGRLSILDILVSKKEIFEKQTERMKEAGYKLRNINYEDFKSFVEGRQFDTVYPTGYHISNELRMQQTIFPLIYNRKWELLLSSYEDFVSSNHPVSLVPTEKEMTRMPLGFGLPGTAVIFPLTPKLCLVGTFEGKAKPRKISKLEAQEINTFTTHSNNRFVYSQKQNFSYLTLAGVKTESHLLEQ